MFAECAAAAQLGFGQLDRILHFSLLRTKGSITPVIIHFFFPTRLISGDKTFEVDRGLGYDDDATAKKTV